MAPSLITAGEAYHLFLNALDSVGLTVYAAGSFSRIVETAKVKTCPIPVMARRLSLLAGQRSASARQRVRIV